MTMTTQRPADLDSLIGQEEIRDRLRIAFAGAKARGTRAPHVLLDGPAGHGKTTIAKIVAQELGVPIEVTTGPSLTKAGDVAGLVARCQPGTILFVDEIHRMPITVAETLYEVMEDGTLTIIAGSGQDAKTMTLTLPPITVIGATTEPGMLSAPLRSRFGMSLTVRPYTDGELARIVARCWRMADADYDDDAAAVVADRCKGVPRIALHLAERVLDVSAIMSQRIDVAVAEGALEAFGVQAGGIDPTDLRILDLMTGMFAGRTVGIDAIAQALDLSAKTIVQTHEGPLIRAGYLVRTKGGRMATPEAFARMGRGS